MTQSQSTLDPEFFDPFSSPSYDEGKNQALTGGSAVRPEDPMYMIGYEKGVEMRKQVEGKALTEDRTEPPPRSSLPSVTELELKLNELKRGAPSIPPAHVIGPVLHTRLLVEQAERHDF